MMKRGLIAAAAVPWLAFAQGASGEESSKKAYEEIVVTAQRTEESIQDVPIAVSAFTGQMLEDKQIISPSDLQLNTPNVSFTATNFGSSSFSIRGIGRLVTAGSGDAGVSIHLDEIAMPTNLPAAEFYDLERVEVLRGPQGTLFGRNATGGAINMITAKPDLDGWAGNVDMEYGSYQHMRLKGMLNLPITETFGIRFAGMDLEREGYIRNTAAGQVGNLRDGGVGTLANIDDDIDGRDLYTFRITALWDITENMSGWVQYGKFKENDDKVRITNQICKRNTLPVQGCEPDGFGFDTPHAGSTTGGIFGGLIGAVTLGNPTPPNAFEKLNRGYRTMHTDFEPVYKYDEESFTGSLSYQFEKFTVTLQGGYQETEYLSQQDYLMDVGFTLDATPANPDGYWPTSAPAGGAGADWGSGPCSFNGGTAGIFGGCLYPADTTRVFAYDQSDSEAKYWTTELRVQSAFDGMFNFMVGTNLAGGESHGDYYVLANTLDMVGVYGVPGLGFPPLYPTLFDSTGEPGGKGYEFDSTAYFGEAYFQVTDTVKITAGIRYNDDEKQVSDSGVLFNSLDAAVFGLGPPGTWLRSQLAGYVLGAGISPTDSKLFEFHNLLTQAQAAPDLAGRFAVARQVPFAPGFGEQRFITGSPSKEDWQETTGRLGFDWQIGEDSMVFAFITRGYKPGGFNPPLNASFIDSGQAKYTFDPEQVDAIEIGTKNVFMDGSLVVNGSVFSYKYDGLQIARIAFNNAINDNIDAKIHGLELETVWRPDALPNLAIDMAYSYLKAEADGSVSVDPLNRTAGDPNFITLENIDPGSLTGINYIARTSQITPALITNAFNACRALSAANPNGSCPETAPGTDYPNGIPAYFSRAFLTANGVETSDGFSTSLDGNQLPSSPEHTIHIGIAYTVNLDMGELTPRWDYYWQDDMYGREFNTVGDQIDAWDQHNASILFESSDGKWAARAWVRNIMNDDNITGKYLTSDTSGFFRNYFLTEPRIYGASFKYNFGAGS